MLLVVENVMSNGRMKSKIMTGMSKGEFLA